MARREFQTGESTFPTDAGSIGETLPSELSDRYFQNLDAALARIEGRQMERTLGDLEGRGFLRSGETFSRVAEDVLGPSVERRAGIVLPEMQRAAGEGREERLQGVAFERQKEFQRIQHQNRLEEISKQTEINRMLMELEDSLSGGKPGFLDYFGQGLGILGGGVLGGLGAKIGAKIGGGGGGESKT